MAQQKYLKTYLVNQVPLRWLVSINLSEIIISNCFEILETSKDNRVQAEAMRMIAENNNSLNHLLEDAGQLNQVLSKIEESERTNP